jgi:mannose-6-phosphate isomerase-like protein (cupin superfamily)
MEKGKKEIVQKGWGYEEIWANTCDYAAKILHFNAGARFSMHMHKVKDETWYVLSGSFKLVVIDTNTAAQKEILLNPGDVWRNVPMLPHQLVCLEEGKVLEASTADSAADNYRVLPGDSQR